MNNSDNGFISRWSRKKRAADPTQASDTAPVDCLSDDVDSATNKSAGITETDSQSSSVQLTPAVDSEIGSTIDSEQATGQSSVETATSDVLTDADMVPLDTLDADSDYSPFLSEGVSSELKKAALKKLFFSGKFALRDGLDDYDDDFTYFEPLGDTVTSDMKFHARRHERNRLAKLEEERLQLEADSKADSEAQLSGELEADDQKAEAEQQVPDEVEQDSPGTPSETPEADEEEEGDMRLASTAESTPEATRQTTQDNRQPASKSHSDPGSKPDLDNGNTA